LRRFFIEGLTVDSTQAWLRGDEFRHLKVLRLSEGDRVALFNGRGLEFKGVISSIKKDAAGVAIQSAAPSQAESPLDIVLLAGLPKGQKPDLIVQKATELGVKSIIFYCAGRSVPLARGARTDKRLDRWGRIALEAVKQCGRSAVPLISFEQGLKEAMARASSAGIKLFFDEHGGRPVGEALEGWRGRSPQGLALLIGPEGGFTDEERDLALRSAYVACGLGPRILRAETAAIAVVAIVQNLLGDL